MMGKKQKARRPIFLEGFYLELASEFAVRALAVTPELATNENHFRLIDAFKEAIEKTIDPFKETMQSNSRAARYGNQRSG